MFGHSTPVGAGIDLHSSLEGIHQHLAPTGIQVSHGLGIDRELFAPICRVLGEFLGLHHRGHQCCLIGDHVFDQVGRQAGAVLDAVDARADQAGEYVVAKTVSGDFGALFMGSSDRAGEGLCGE